jgi:rod shape-determining protein MreD
MSAMARANRLQFAAVMVVLLLLHFYVRPRLWDARLSPDFLTMALVIFAMRSSPGTGAIAGFVVGLASDALTPARPGAGALAGTIIGFLAAWGRAVFFADAVWLRDLVVLWASGTARAALMSELVVYGPLQALVTAIFAVLLLVAFREWFAIRLDL